MAAIKVFRADRRVFPVGKAIETAGDFHKLNRDGEKLEQVMSACKPVNKPARVGSVFVFEFYDDAEWHWAKMANGILYECEIQEHSKLHRGDMRLIDLAGSELSSGRDPVPHAQKYWAGEGTGEPIWELLVTSATVTAVISDSQNLRRERLLHGQRLPWPRTGVDVANTEPGITGSPEEH